MNALHYGGITVDVTVNGRPVRTYPHQGKYFFESRKDSQYEIVVRNNNYYRVEVVASVDGLSVMNGELASKNDSGYIVNGYDKVVIKGYRYSDDSVGAFKFTEKYASYAASKNVEGNAGLIAIAVFAEYVQPASIYSWPQYTFTTATPHWSTGGVLRGSTLDGCHGSNGALGCAGQPGELIATAYNCSTSDGPIGRASDASYSTSKLMRCADEVPAAHGTGWGDKLDDHVNYVSWTRGSEIYSTEIHYNSRENLIAMGVPVVPVKLAVQPVGFPRDHATPPHGWRG